MKQIQINNIAVYIVTWLLALSLVFYFGYTTFPHAGQFSTKFVQNFANWDGSHYTRIAKFGYQQQYQYAFFPLYPILIKTISYITGNFLVSALFISVVSTCAGIFLLHKLLSKEFGSETAEASVLNLLIFPTSFFFVTAYSEGFFFLTVVASFYFLCMFEKRKKFSYLLYAVFFSALATATRITGLALALTLIIWAIKVRSSGFGKWIVIFAPLGILLYSIYVFVQTGNPIFYLEAEKINWQRYITVPGISVYLTLASLARPGFILEHFQAFLDLLFSVFGLGIILRGGRLLPKKYFFYSLIAISLPLLTPSLSSLPRFLLPIFPIFISVSFVRNRNFQFFYQTFCLMLLSAFAILYISGYWVS